MRVVSAAGGRSFAHAYTPKETAQYENLVRLAASEAMQGREPLRGPVSVELLAILPIPASWSARKRTAAADGAIRPTTKPDIDNIAKSLSDGMNGIVYADDSQVTEAIYRKTYGVTPAVWVRVAPSRA